MRRAILCFTIFWLLAASAVGSEHWSFVPPRRPPLPTVRRMGWARNPIDLFVISQLEQAGLSPSPQADRTQLIRRVTFDLTGLPPTLAELDTFLADDASDAYTRLVDRLLQSPRYGEQRARFWLDAARYGDTHGLHIDNQRSIWPYRDWVIDAYNRNLPFDEFTIQQLAGDLLPDATVAQRVATGFNRCNVSTAEEGSINEEYRMRYAMDRVETTGTVWMGLTVGCAACHDHPYDPISQREFYQLVAVFNNLAEQVMNGNALLPPPAIKAPTRAQVLLRQRLLDQLNQLPSPDAADGAEPLPGSDVARMRVQLQVRLRRLESAFPGTMVMRELGRPRATHLLIRGQYDRKGEQVKPGVPEFLPALPPVAGPDRLALARWLVDRRHPLTARVAVNQIWQQHFGRGIVESSEDLGTQGRPPSHLKLLDWLAVEFIDSGWDIKALQRLIVTSATYRQTAQATVQRYLDDPPNRLLARGPRYRMDAEMIRDQALAVSGLLVEQLGGSGVRPYQPEGIWEAVAHPSSNTANYQTDEGGQLYRRSLYTFWKRTAPPPAMQILDAPSRETCCVRRSRTNSPAAALLMMNDVQRVEAARKLAEYLLATSGLSDAERIAYAFRQATARSPQPDETTDLVRVLDQFRQQYAAEPAAASQLAQFGKSPPGASQDHPEVAAWTMLVSLMLNLDETINK